MSRLLSYAETTSHLQQLYFSITVTSFNPRFLKSIIMTCLPNLYFLTLTDLFINYSNILFVIDNREDLKRILIENEPNPLRKAEFR